MLRAKICRKGKGAGFNSAIKNRFSGKRFFREGRLKIEH